MSVDREGNEARYLGDGAYVSFDGFAFTLYTDDGISISNRVVIEPHSISVLLAFAKTLGVRFEVPR